MKCSNPNCNRGIGLIRYRRSWFSKQGYCSWNCLPCFRGSCTEAATKAQCDVLLRVALFTTDLEFAAETDPRNHPHKGALNIRQQNGNLIDYVIPAACPQCCMVNPPSSRGSLGRRPRSRRYKNVPPALLKSISPATIDEKVAAALQHR